MRRKGYEINKDEESQLELELCSIPLDNWRISGSLIKGNTFSGVGRARTRYKQLRVCVQRTDDGYQRMRDTYYTYEITLEKRGFRAVSSNTSALRAYCPQARQPIAQAVYSHLGNKVEERLRSLGQEEIERLGKKFRGFIGYQNENDK